MITSLDNLQWTNASVAFLKRAVSKMLGTNMDNNAFSLNVWDLSDKVRCNFPRDYCQSLFDSCEIEHKKLAIKLNVTYSHYCHLRRSMYSIPIPLLKRLSEISGISMNLMQKDIISVQTRAGKNIAVRFPIRGNSEIASLVGHVYGDGYIGARKCQFEYCNDNPYLLNEVKRLVLNQFGLVPMTQRSNRIGYPAILGELLKGFGAPTAPKIRSTTPIPEWILESRESFCTFVKAFFDDDGSVMLPKHYRSTGVRLFVIKHIDCQEFGFSLLEQIRCKLRQFGIFASQPRISRRYVKRDGQRLVLYINISDIDSIRNFNRVISLTEGSKHEKLEQICARHTQYSKGQERQIIERIKREFADCRIQSTSELAAKLQIDIGKMLKKLHQLEKQIAIDIIGRVAVNRSYLWKKMEVNQCE